jgi:hypothetical protein
MASAAGPMHIDLPLDKHRNAENADGKLWREGLKTQRG